MLQQLETGVITTGNPALSGALNDTAKEVMWLYDRFKADRMAGNHRIHTGIQEIDVHVPIKHGDFVGVLGYAGQRKSTLCRTIAYNAAKQGFNVLHVSLEQTYNEERINYSLIHSADPKFASYNLKPTKKNFEDGCLSEEEEKYLRDIVLPDLEENLPGRLIIRQPTDGSSWSNIKMLAEMTNQTTPIDLFLVDYLALVSTSSGRDAREEMERNIKDAKQMALQFDNGRGVVFLTPIQGNRKGYEEAKSTNGVWDMTGVNLYSEFDKSADLILSTFIDEALQEESSISISSVKIRRAPPLPLFTTPVNCHVGLIGAPYSLSLAREEDEVGFSTLDNMFRTIENAV
jgi:archaellum biogenesis ATPase FlaH